MIKELEKLLIKIKQVSIPKFFVIEGHVERIEDPRVVEMQKKIEELRAAEEEWKRRHIMGDFAAGEEYIDANAYEIKAAAIRMEKLRTELKGDFIGGI